MMISVSLPCSIFIHTLQQAQGHQPSTHVFLEPIQIVLTCSMRPSVTSVLRESTAQVVNQHPEVTVHQATTVQVAQEWQNSFHVLMEHIIHTTLRQGLMSVLTAHKAISASWQLFSQCHVQ